LGNNQHGSAHIRQREIHFPLGIGEQSKPRRFLGHPIDFVGRIAVGEANEKKKTLPDAPSFSVANADFCPRDPLE
jgi:hypothetical protein